MVSLTETDEDILDVLQEGRGTQRYIVDESGRSRQHVHVRLQVLSAAGYVENIHPTTALYELQEDPRENSEETERDDSTETE